MRRGRGSGVWALLVWRRSFSGRASANFVHVLDTIDVLPAALRDTVFQLLAGSFAVAHASVEIPLALICSHTPWLLRLRPDRARRPD